MGRDWGGHIVDQKETDWVGGGGLHSPTKRFTAATNKEADLRLR